MEKIAMINAPEIIATPMLNFFLAAKIINTKATTALKMLKIGSDDMRLPHYLQEPNLDNAH
jgi:hypothetical protein